MGLVHRQSTRDDGRADYLPLGGFSFNEFWAVAKTAKGMVSDLTYQH